MQKMNLRLPNTPLSVGAHILKAVLVNSPYFSLAETQDADGETDPNVQEEVVITETVQTIDITHSAVIMPTIPMALAAAASNSVPPPDSVQPLVGNSAPQDRAVLHPL